MPKLALKDACSFKAWAAMLAGGRHSHEFPEARAQVDFFGTDDATYMVIDVYASDTSAVEYVFLAADEDEHGRTLILIFDLLNSLGFSLSRLLHWLEDVAYTPGEMGDMAFVNGLSVRRCNVCAVLPKKNGVLKMTEEITVETKPLPNVAGDGGMQGISAEKISMAAKKMAAMIEAAAARRQDGSQTRKDDVEVFTEWV